MKSRKNLSPGSRIANARRWLRTFMSGNLLKAYCKRYHVSSDTAYSELAGLGYYDHLLIQEFEQKGQEWEYEYDTSAEDIVPVLKRNQHIEDFPTAIENTIDCEELPF